MIPVALGLAWAGGWWWAGVVLLISAGLFIEWASVVDASKQRPAIIVGLVAIAAAGVLAAQGHASVSVVISIVGAIIAAFVARERRVWLAVGVVYAATAMISAIIVRQDDLYGFTALLFILLIVWLTDIGGYFFGRGLGGPKLWPRVSPNKTWAGALGGVVLSIAVAIGFAVTGGASMAALLLVALLLTVSSQIGDLFESAVKRRFGVKDSSQIIPGHGGLLDRLDGFVFAIAVGAIVGLLRGGADGVGRGLMVW